MTARGTAERKNANDLNNSPENIISPSRNILAPKRLISLTNTLLGDKDVLRRCSLEKNILTGFELELAPDGILSKPDAML
jgi:hypothetical protein